MSEFINTQNNKQNTPNKTQKEEIKPIFNIKDKYNLWKESIHSFFQKSSRSYVVERKKLTHNKSEINYNSMENIPFDNIPDDAISIVLYDSYKSNASEFNQSQFVKLSSCEKTCPNNGIFDKSELDMLLSMKSSKNKECPLCKNKFDMFKEETTPPYGKLNISLQRQRSCSFYRLEFHMNSGMQDGRRYGGRSQTAYIPYSSDCGESDLALWLMIQAWANGRLFTIGVSVTHGGFGIVFSGIHMKTNTRGGLNCHGYGRIPLNDLRNSVLPNLISECNSVDIFTPEQLDDFFENDPKLINALLKNVY